MKIFLTHIAILFIFSSSILAQSGSSVKEFEKKLSDYYDQDLIADVISAIGDEQAKIWSWDIGDYSSDSHNDVAFVARYPKERSKICSVYFFIDINGTLTPVHKQARAYVESPLEVGIAIKNGGCHVTSKNEQFNWNITGYQFRQGVFFESDQFSTSRNAGQTIEIHRDNLQRRNKTHVFSTRSEETSYYHHYHDIPVYSTDFIIPYGYHKSIVIDAPEDVIKGAFYWSGPKDASIIIEKSTYDNSNWELGLLIIDDTLIHARCDTCLQDKILIHISDNIPGFIKNVDKDSTKHGIIQTIELNPNSETPYLSFMRISGMETKSLITFHRVSDGYHINAKIPISILSRIDIDKLSKEKISIGCTFEMIDVDNPFRPEEQTRIVDSDYDYNDLGSLGKLTFYPKHTFDGEIHRHYAQQFVQTLQQLGF
jgi:hypothetical protein